MFATLQETLPNDNQKTEKFLLMEHQGARLRQIIKAKGFNMSELAQDFGVTRAAIEKHFRSERITRKVLKPYSEKFGFSLDSFFEENNLQALKAIKKPDTSTELAFVQATGSVPAEIHSELQRKYFELQERYNDLVVRFFPNAAQLVTA